MMTRDNVNCKDVMQHICGSLGEDLQSERCIDIKKHLETCNGCKTYFKTVELTIGYYKKYNVELPEDAHNKLMASLGLNE